MAKIDVRQPPGYAADGSALVPKSLVDAKGDLLAATADDTLTRLAVGTDGYALVADSLQATGLAWVPRSRVAAESHADAGSASSVAEQTLASLTIPTSVAAGDLLHVHAAGDSLNNSGSNVTYLWRLKVGATTVLASAQSTIAASSSRRRWWLDAVIFITSTAAQFTRAALVHTAAGADSTWGGVQNHFVGALASAVDTSTTKNVVLTCELGTSVSTADVIHHNSSLIVVKKA